MNSSLSPTLVAMIASIGVVSGCATIPSHGGFSDVQEMVEPRTGARVQWSQGTAEDVAVEETIRRMMLKRLTADAAVQIALLNNHSLRARFEELGIAQADVVQAGLLHNPVFAASARFPDSGGRINTEFSVAQNFLEIFLLPLRKKLAAEQFKQAKFRVGNAVLDLVGDVRSAYHEFQGEQQVLTLRRAMLEAAEAATELAQRQYEAGNINALELAGRQATFHQVKLDLARGETEVLTHQEHLSQLMGLSGAEEDWRIIEQLPDLPRSESEREPLEVLALSQRLDLAAARQEKRILEKVVSVTRSGILPAIEVGVNTERELDRTQLTGPTLSLEIPIFDQRQAAVARVKAQLRQSEHRLAALERSVRSQVRTTHAQLFAARGMVEAYRTNILPIHAQRVASSQRHYNYMLKGVYALLQAKVDELQARVEFIEALETYWMTRADLERAIGGRLPVTESEG